VCLQHTCMHAYEDSLLSLSLFLVKVSMLIKSNISLEVDLPDLMTTSPLFKMILQKTGICLFCF